MSWAILGPQEPFVVLNQGHDYLEGYLAKKPKVKYEALETDLERIQRDLKHPTTVRENQLVAVHWDKQLRRGIVVNAAGFFVEVFLLDHGILECCSKAKLYILPEEYHQVPAYGVRILLENPQTQNLRDTTVVATSLRRLSWTTARGLVSNEAVVPQPQQNGIEHSETNGKCDPEPELPEISSNGFDSREIITKPPNELLLEMIGTRFLLTKLKVQQVTSPVEILCSHYFSWMVVQNAFDSMTELPVPVPHELVEPNMLVLVLSKATLRRGIVAAIFNHPETVYRVEFIDLPGYAESSLLYYPPSNISRCAPRALLKVRLNRRVQNIQPLSDVSLLCDKIHDNMIQGDLVGSEIQSMMKLNNSKL